MKEFFKKFGCGAAIGVGVIIPGVSGGTIAVLLNIYDRLILSISSLRRDFKNSFMFLLPVVLGIVAAFAAMYFPLKLALERAPLPTVLLFLGLMVGSFPKIFADGLKLGFKKTDVAALILPLAAVIGVCFIPNIGDVNLGADMSVGTYFMLLLMGALAACALVVPGVSGSMLLMIFGYYQPILNIISEIFSSFGHTVLVLGLFAVGIIVGFFSIAKLMKFLLEKFPRGTRWAIIGFVAGSLPALLITFDFASSPTDTSHILVGVVLCLFAAVLSFFFTNWAQERANKATEVEEVAQEDNIE